MNESNNLLSLYCLFIWFHETIFKTVVDNRNVFKQIFPFKYVSYHEKTSKRIESSGYQSVKRRELLSQTSDAFRKHTYAWPFSLQTLLPEIQAKERGEVIQRISIGVLDVILHPCCLFEPNYWIVAAIRR